MKSAMRLGVLMFLAVAPRTAAEEQKNLAASLTTLGYLGERAHRMAALLPPIPGDLAAWAERRQTVRRSLERLLGLPQREPMRAKVLSSRPDGEVTVEDVMYQWGERAYVSANVVRPKQPDGPLPALVVPPGWLGQLKQECYKTFVYHLARKGYLLLFIDDPHVGKRAAPCAGLYGAASAAGTQVMGIQVFDTLRGLDYLLTRSDVDPNRIGVAGLCQGSEQTWLAAALEDRFKIAMPVCGTTTYQEWARMPSVLSIHLSDPSPYVANVLRYSDWHEINACLAPRPVYIASNSGDNWWPVRGYDKVVSTLEKTFRLYGKPELFRHLRVLRSHSMTPFIPELAPWIDQQLKSLPALARVSPKSSAEPVDPDFSMLHYLQRRLVRQTEALPAAFPNRDAWQTYRNEVREWLKQTCDVQAMRLGEVQPISRRVADGLMREVVRLPQDQALEVPLTLYHEDSSAPRPRPAIILSHDSGQHAADPSVVEIAKTLASDGYLVCVAEHASPNRASQRHVKNIGSLYGAGDTVGLPPIAMRVWDDLCAQEYLCRRPDVAKNRVALVGLGVGGVDAALAAACDERIAALAVVGPITVRDWAQQVAPKLNAFDCIMPYLPDITTKTDLQYVYSAAAPRPLLLVDASDRLNWPAAAYQRTRAMAQHVYALHDGARSLTALPAHSPWGINEIRQWLHTNLKPVVTVVPADKQAILTRQEKEKRWILHLLRDGDYAVDIRKDFALSTRIIRQYPAEGWKAEAEKTGAGLRISVRGAAKDRLLVLQ